MRDLETVLKTLIQKLQIAGFSLEETTDRRDRFRRMRIVTPARLSICLFIEPLNTERDLVCTTFVDPITENPFSTSDANLVFGFFVDQGVPSAIGLRFIQEMIDGGVQLSYDSNFRLALLEASKLSA